MERRKDAKGRVLKEGESQRKDGRYQYRWTDRLGKRHVIYDSELKKLREKEKDVLTLLETGLTDEGRKTTVLQLVEKYAEIRRDSLKEASRLTHQTVINHLRKETFGGYRISDIKYSDAKAWMKYLSSTGLVYSSLHTIKKVMNQAFQMACENDIIYRNPFSFKLNQIVKNETKKKKALGKDDYKRMLDFVAADKSLAKYYDEIVFLHETGLRVSEFCGLTIHDIDLDKKRISVSRQLIKRPDGTYYTSDLKTDSGERYIPLSAAAEESIRRLMQKKRASKGEPIVDGVGGFILVKSNGRPKVSCNIERDIKSVVKKYNNLNPLNPLPDGITPHTFRHTFCTEMINAGMTVKAVQYLMGHTDVSTTLNVYTEARYENVESEFLNHA